MISFNQKQTDNNSLPSQQLTSNSRHFNTFGGKLVLVLTLWTNINDQNLHIEKYSKGIRKVFYI